MYDRTDIEHGFLVRFSAAFAGIDRVCLEVDQFLYKCGLADASFDVILGLREAMTNAVRHGSNLDNRLIVECSVQYQSGRLQARISDQGPGFNWQECEKKAQTQSLAEIDNTSGRGISILNMYFDSCQYNDKGNEVLLTKDITASSDIL